MFNNLREALRTEGITIVLLAKMLNLSEKTVANKLNGVTEWQLSEIQTIRMAVPKYDADWLFEASEKTA